MKKPKQPQIAFEIHGAQAMIAWDKEGNATTITVANQYERAKDGPEIEAALRRVKL